MIWLWVVGYLVVACGVAYLVGRFGSRENREVAMIAAVVWPAFIAVNVCIILPATILHKIARLGERHRK